MKFFYADSLDYIDPEYNFEEDRSKPRRKPYWDDVFPHEYLTSPPYDGVLVSRGIVGDHKFAGKYTQSQAMRFRREGARKFLRLDRPEFADLEILGDCGAFSYVDHEIPPYTPTEILEFYDDGGFTHGCSVDHVIFEFERSLKGMEGLADQEGTDRVSARFEITLENAEAFYKESSQMSGPFTPLGVVQGWSPGSMAEAARRLVGMGYDYLAVGGMVPLSAESIHIALTQMRELLPSYVRLHILGFGKIDQVGEFLDYGIASIDTTSPMVRAFKDNKRNFFSAKEDGSLEYFTAIRIPHSTDSRLLSVLVKQGHFTSETLIEGERVALDALRRFDKGLESLEATLQSIMAYSRMMLTNPKTGEAASDKKLNTLESDYRNTLEHQPWKHCVCRVCQEVSVEAAIFRSSNRNKRRGIHNLYVFNDRLRQITQGNQQHEKQDPVHGDTRAAK